MAWKCNRKIKIEMSIRCCKVLLLRGW